MTDIQDTYDALTRLASMQLDEVVNSAGVPSKYVPPSSEAAAKRALALIEWAKSTDDNLTALRSALDRIQRQSGVVTLTAQQPPPRHFSLLFDRDDQEGMLGASLKECFGAGQRVATILLPGPPNESHADFVARYEKFTLRKICRELEVPYHVDCKSLPWPLPNRAQEKRLRSLFENLSALMGQGRSGKPDGEMHGAVSAWLAGEKKHKIITYQLFRKNLCGSDAALVRRWIDFWSKLDISQQPYSITVFFCIQSSKYGVSRFIGRSARCIKRARKAFKAQLNVLVLDHLKAPTLDDVDPWVEEKCGEAWGMWQGSIMAQSAGDQLPLNYDALRFHAEESFRRKFGPISWRLHNSPFSRLKPRLEDAIEKAHQVFAIKGSGR